MKLLKTTVLLILGAAFLLSCGKDAPVTGPSSLDEPDKGPMISGHVYNVCTGLPVAGVTVMVLDQLSGEWYGTGTSNESGAYAVWDDENDPQFNYEGTYCKVIWSKQPSYYDLVRTWVLLPQFYYDVPLVPHQIGG